MKSIYKHGQLCNLCALEQNDNARSIVQKGGEVFLFPAVSLLTSHGVFLICCLVPLRWGIVFFLFNCLVSDLPL